MIVNLCIIHMVNVLAECVVLGRDLVTSTMIVNLCVIHMVNVLAECVVLGNLICNV